MRNLRTLLCLLLVAASTTAVAQQTEKSRPSLLGSNAEGMRFFVGFMQNEADDGRFCGRNLNTLLISISSRYDAAVRIIYPDGRRTDTTVKSFGVTTIDVTYDTVTDFECFGEGVFRKGIEILADRPVSVVSYNSRPQTSDGYLALPVSSWGQDYVIAAYYVDHYFVVDSAFDARCAGLPRPGELAVMAAEDSTLVTVFPTTPTLRGMAAGAPYARLLNRGDIFQVQDGGTIRRTRINPGTDITGSRVIASKPVGVLSGHVRAAVPTVYETKDHLVEMIPPISTLGLTHIVVPFKGREGGDVVRIVTTAPTTSYTVTNVGSGTQTYTITGSGEFQDLDLREATVITSSAPVLVVQYSKSTESDPRNVGIWPPRIRFDPDMVVISPEEQFVNTAVFQTLQGIGAQFERHSVTVVIERDAYPTLKINGRAVSTLDSIQWGDVPGRPYRWVRFELPGGRVYVMTADGLFGGYLYGTGHVDSYAWPIGSGLRRSLPDSTAPLLAAEPDCGGFRVVARDTGITQRGLAEVLLDTSVSVNAVLEGVTFPIGAELAVLRVRQIDPTKTAFARVIARDLARNQSSIDITIEPSAVIVRPDSVDLGMVDIGTTYSRRITIENPGNAAAHLDSVVLAIGGAFRLDGPIRDITIVEGGGNYTLDLRFRIGVKQTTYDTLIIWVDCRAYRIPLIARSDVPGIATHDLDFGRVRVGRERRLPLAVWNTGYATLRLDSAVLNGAVFALTATPTLPVMIAPGDTAVFEVAFRPLAVGLARGSVRFYSNVEDSVAFASLVGVGIYPNLWIAGHDFGQIQVGDTSCTRIPVVNTGTDTATITALDLRTPAGFVVDPTVFPRKLAPGDTLFVPVCFVPDDERSYASDILPRNEDDLNASNAIIGRGYRLIASISGADMGRWRINTRHDSVVYVTNYGTEPITVTRVWIEGGDVGDFYVEPLNQPVVLAPGARQPVAVRFMPLLAGYRSCYIHAATSSRERPVIDSVLWGFGLMPLSSHRLDFDSSLAYACRTRGGTVVIYNDGNTPLTFASIGSGWTGAPMTLNAPAAGFQIAVGDSIALDFRFAFGGYTGVATGYVAWQFEELPDAPRRTDFSVAAAPQFYAISATAPASVGVGESFGLVVAVDSAYWRSVYESELEVKLTFNPSMLRFDERAWTASDDGVSAWAPRGFQTPSPGTVVVTFEPRAGAPLQIYGAQLPPIPLQAFLGDADTDSIDVSLTAIGNDCAGPADAMRIVTLDSICGLAQRLMEFTGEPFALAQSQPNPGSISTLIAFTLPMEAPTRLELFDASGGLVRRLVDATMSAGEYSLVLELDDIPNGTYFYRLTSGSGSAVRSLQVAK